MRKKVRNGNQQVSTYRQYRVRGGSRAAALYSRKAHNPAQNPKIVAHHEKGKVPAANKRKGACGEGAWWAGALKGSAREMVHRTDNCVVAKAHAPLAHHSPSGASGPGANFGTHFGDVLMVFGPFLLILSASVAGFCRCLAFKRFAFKWPVSLGCGGERSASTIWLLASLLRPFSMKIRCKNRC